LISKEPWITRRSDGQIHIAPHARNAILGFVAVYAAFFLTMCVDIWQPSRPPLLPADSPQVAEARAWLDGRTDLPERMYDTALVDGKCYNVFPPMMTFVALPCLAIGWAGVPMTLVATLFVLPIPGLAFVLFSKRCRSATSAVVLTCAFVLGTSEFLILSRALQSAGVWQLNHAVSQLGLVLFLVVFVSRRNHTSLLVSGVGLMVMGWSRYTMILYVIPYVWRVWTARTPSQRRLGLSLAVVAVAVPMLITTLRFGHPLALSYAKIYEGRTNDPDDFLARDGSEAVFSLRYVPRNLYWMNLGLPTIPEHRGSHRWQASVYATGIWWTTPLLLFVFWDRRRIWNDHANRWLLAPVAMIFVILMLYHNMGYAQRGYNRFSLDFVLVLLSCVAPFAMSGHRRYITVAMVAWSVVYFRWIVQ
jgi:hypothetical protein